MATISRCEHHAGGEYHGHCDLCGNAVFDGALGWDEHTCPPAFVDHPHTDPGDGRTECPTCGKYVWRVTHSCKGVPVTPAARARWGAR